MLIESKVNLESMLDDEFQKKFLAAVINNLSDASNPLAFNNFCTSFRELVRHVLRDLAPDSEIQACKWFKPDNTSKTGITRAHAITYIVQGGLLEEYLVNTLKIDVNKEKHKLLSTINELSKFVHIEEKTFGTDVSVAEVKADSAVRALISMLVCAKECRSSLARSLEAQISKEVFSVAISETIQSIDSLATHHSIEEIYVEETLVESIDSSDICFNASGSIGVQLQWGSNGDVRRGDGLLSEESFPFTCELRSSVESPEKVEADPGNFCVNTSSWWENYTDGD